MVKRHATSPPIEELLERHFSYMDLVLNQGIRRTYAAINCMQIRTCIHPFGPT
jgi:hypothetical protein